jgi:hypothetical protein
MVVFGWRITAGNKPILVALLLQILSPFVHATIASAMRFPRVHSERRHRSLSSVKFLVFWVRGLFRLCNTSSSDLMRSHAVLFAETYNYIPFSESSFVLWLSIPCNSHHTGLGSTPKQVPFQLCLTGGMEYIPCYRMITVMIKWENLDEVLTCLMVL